MPAPVQGFTQVNVIKQLKQRIPFVARMKKIIYGYSFVNVK
jgi:hypothetical protein